MPYFLLPNSTDLNHRAMARECARRVEAGAAPDRRQAMAAVIEDALAERRAVLAANGRAH